LLVGWDYVPFTADISGLLYQPQMIGEGDCGTFESKFTIAQTEVRYTAVKVLKALSINQIKGLTTLSLFP
jgi:hypothetical protein